MMGEQKNLENINSECEKPIDLTVLLNERRRVLYEKKVANTLNDWDFVGVWDAHILVVLLKLEIYITQSLKAKEGYSLDDTIIYGQLARLFDLLKLQRRLVLEDIATLEILIIIQRCLLETTITLQYLLENQTIKGFNDFRMGSLRMLSSYEDEVLKSIANNGIKTKMEDAILNSIQEAYGKAGVTRLDIDSWSNRQTEIPKFEERFKALGEARLYNISYKSGSQSVHGNWKALINNYFYYDIIKGAFFPKLEDTPIDIRVLNPSLIHIVKVLKLFLTDYKGHGFDIPVNIEQLDFLLDDICDLELEHEKFLGR